MKKNALLCLVSLAVAITVQAGTIFVDGSSPIQGNGSQEAPYQTIQEALNIAMAGDAVRIHAGNYPENAQLLRSGSLNAPIDVSAIGDGEVSLKSLTLGEALSSVAFVSVRGLSLGGTSPGEETYGIFADGPGSFGLLVEDCRVRNVLIGILVKDGSQQIRLLGNFVQASQIGIGLRGCKDGIIRGNQITGINDPAGMLLQIGWGSENLVIDQNRLYDNTARWGIVLGADNLTCQAFGARNVAVRNNFLHNNSCSATLIGLYGTQHCHIQGNQVTGSETNKPVIGYGIELSSVNMNACSSGPQNKTSSHTLIKDNVFINQDILERLYFIRVGQEGALMIKDNLTDEVCPKLGYGCP